EEQVAPELTAAAVAEVSAQELEPELLQLTEADAPRLEIPPPSFPDFELGAPLLPERSHDPHYYPGISDEPPPPELPRPRWPRWAAFAAGGLVLFGAGMIVRSMAGGGGGNAVIDVTPLDAKVQLDGELLEVTSSPRLREGLIHGEHTLEVERRGFISQRRVFNLAEGEREQRVVITLLPEPVAPPPAAAPPPPAAATPAPAAPQPVAKAAEEEPATSDKPLSAKELAKQRRAEKVAERYRARKAAAAEGKASKSDAKLSRAEAKAARLEAKAAKAEKAAQAKSEKADAKAGRKAAAGAPTAMLKLNSTPWSEVYVDDRHVGHTPVLGLPLTAGKHTIRLVNPQLGGKKTIKIQLKPGQTLVKIVQL
ncbi:MAG TPA: PEGA domain-containing protein, partial [Polyangiales bacterium]|nr:PEGA domain-containing protein [Polyangiales bacterium]